MELDRIISHKKNLLFLKLVMYVVTIIIMNNISHIIQDEASYILQRNERARNFVVQINRRIKSFRDSETLATTPEMWQFHQAIEVDSCLERQIFFKNIANYLDTPENTVLFRNLNIDISALKRTDTRLSTTYNMDTKCQKAEILLFAANRRNFYQFISYLTGNLPKGAVVSRVTIVNSETLTNEELDYVVQSNTPLLFGFKVEVLFREVSLPKEI